jgi:hypothetical protein
MNWQQYINNLYKSKKGDESVGFYPPSSYERILAVELSLGIKLPPPLKDLLTDTNGVMALMKLGEQTIKTSWLIWPIEEIERQNSSFRVEAQKATYGRSFDDLLFFASAGADGILFAYRIPAGQVSESEIYVWHPMENTLRGVAPSLETFIKQWVTGEILV